MSHAFFFLCPQCYSEDSLTATACSVCNAPIHISSTSIRCNNQLLSTEQYYDLLQRQIRVKQTLPTAAAFSEDNLLRVSGTAILRQGIRSFWFEGYHHIFAMQVEKPEEVARGHLLIFPERAEFRSPQKVYSWNITDITCVTTNGHYFEFKVKNQPFFQIHFPGESPLKYEIIFRKWLDSYYENREKKKVLEYQPRVRFQIPRAAERNWSIPPSVNREKSYLLEKMVMGGIARLLKLLLGIRLRVSIFGKEHWHRGNRGIVLVNHQSALDPFILGAYLDRQVAFLTKSTSFAHLLPRWFLKWALAIPTTRYQTDPRVVLAMRRMLRRGIRVGIFPEGERCWGGAMQPFKLSLVKVLMASREAIYPVVLKNAFQFWPRWSKFPRHTGVEIHIRPPFCLIPDHYSVDEQRRFLEEQFQSILNSGE